jgi:hypothetical protein
MCSDPDPAWLPEMVDVNPWVGGAGGTYDALYAIFHHDFVASKPQYDGRVVWYFPDIDDGRELVFWHLTSREEKPKPVPRRMRHVLPPPPAAVQRFPDLRRSERLPWVRPLIEHAAEAEVWAWDYLEGNGNIHTYVWLRDWDFVVIMKKYPARRRRLITSFYVDSDYKRQDLERKYANRIP